MSLLRTGIFCSGIIIKSSAMLGNTYENVDRPAQMCWTLESSRGMYEANIRKGKAIPFNYLRHQKTYFNKGDNHNLNKTKFKN